MAVLDSRSRAGDPPINELADQTERMVSAARRMEDEADPESTMRAAVAIAAEVVPHCDAAAVSIVQRRGRLRSPAYTDALAKAGDQMQYELGEGPCVDAVWDEPLVHSADLAEEDRWPTWAPRVVRDLGARSMICFRLFTYADTVGALNLYSRRARAFDTGDRDEGLALAAHVAIAVAGAQRDENLKSALDTRTLIAQATGILMERHGLAPDRAFAVLVRISSHCNLKLHAVAHHLVTTRELLGDEEE